MKIDSIKKIANLLDMPEVAQKLETRLHLLSGKKIRVSVIGSANAGKTTFLNAIAGTDIEVSSLPSEKSYIVCTDRDENQDVIVSDNQWLKNKDIEISELQENTLGPNPEIVDYGVLLAGSDICVLLFNSYSALSRSDVSLLNVLQQLSIPTILLLSKADQLKEEDYKEVESYVISKTLGYNNINFIVPDEVGSISTLAIKVQNEIDNIINDSDPRTRTRVAFARLFAIDAITCLFEKCNEKINGALKSVEKIEMLAEEKKTKMSDASSQWIILHNELMRRRSETSTKIGSSFESRRIDNVRVLSHNIDLCNDIKLYWEKELPYRLEDIMRSNAQVASQIINADVVSTINWLNLEIKKVFNRNLNSIQPVSCKIENEPFAVNENPGIADNRKIRIVTRIGTAAIVVAAGTMCATMGVGGIVMATSMLSGLGAEFFMNRKQKESKEKIKSLIPQMLERAQMHLVTSVSDNLGKAYDEILKGLQSYQESWTDDMIQSINKEKQIALFNINEDKKKWVDCMNTINAISEELQNN